jgi:hypothetical protein
MPKKKKVSIWYGCKDCNYKADKDESKSNKNWDVFTPKNCSICNKPMKPNF